MEPFGKGHLVKSQTFGKGYLVQGITKASEVFVIWRIYPSCRFPEQHLVTFSQWLVTLSHSKSVALVMNIKCGLIGWHPSKLHPPSQRSKDVLFKKRPFIHVLMGLTVNVWLICWNGLICLFVYFLTPVVSPDVYLGSFVLHLLLGFCWDQDRNLLQITNMDKSLLFLS